MKVRFASSKHDIEAAQRLRFQVFKEEFGFATGRDGLDADKFDAIAEHLLVVDEENQSSLCRVEEGALVGTYRLITQARALEFGGFYSQASFDLEPLLARKNKLKFLELGRSCVLRPYRGSAVIELLWRGIWDFVRKNRIDVMIGCASFEGTDLIRHAVALSYLARHHAAPPEWFVTAHREKHEKMALLPDGSFDANKAKADLPPLVRGYLRLGCYFGDGAVLDQDFNSIDVLVILPVASIDARFFARFGSP